MTSADMYNLRAENLASLTTHLHGSCFDYCTDRTDVPFMTIKEGLCFRNCITKFSVWYPTLGANIQDSAHSHYASEIAKIENQRSGATTDPWEGARAKLLNEIQKSAF